MAPSFADIHRPLARYFRSRRLRRFGRSFNVDEQTKVLDLAGPNTIGLGWRSGLA